MSPAVSIAFQTDHPLAAYGPLAALAEGHGFDGVSVYNDLLYQPAWPALFEIARATRRVRIGPAAMNPFTCHPVTLAGHVALLDEASGGRAYLGLARGAWLDYLGLDPAQPVTALREAFECVRHLLRGDRRPYRGRVFSLAGGETLRWPVPRSEVPFLLGAWGPRAIRACAPHVDEVKVGGTASPRVVRAVLGELRAATAQAGRPPDAVGLAVGAVSVVDRDGGAARALARQKVALYLPVIARLDPALPVEPEQVRRIEAARAAGDIAARGPRGPGRGPPEPRARGHAGRRGGAGARAVRGRGPAGRVRHAARPRRGGRGAAPRRGGAPEPPPAGHRRRAVTAPRRPDEFELYDLALVVERIEGQCTCDMRVGDRVELRGGKLAIADARGFCLYALQAALPLLPAKQRPSHPADWMETDTRVTCPDPACRLIMRIERTGRRVLRHDDVSAVPWEPPDPGVKPDG